MADLSTSYMGIPLSSPVVVGACSYSKHLDRIREIEAKGAGALVIKSLFEEQIQLESQELEEALDVGADFYQEAPSYFPDLSHAGPEEHLHWVQKAREAVKMPLIASLNASSMGTWVDWARRLEETGVNGLELNVFVLGSRDEESGADIEKRMLDMVAAVIGKVSIPVAVKLGTQLTSPAHIVAQLKKAGAQGVVLFNRFFQPDIDIAAEKLVMQPHFSRPEEALLTLRWVGLLAGRFGLDIAAGTGVHDAAGVAKMLLAGAQVTQVASTLYVNSLNQVAKLNEGLSRWMDEKGYANLDAFRGKLAHDKLDDAWGYERAQYIKLLLGFD